MGIFLRKSGTKDLAGSWGSLASKLISLTPKSFSPLGKADTGKVSGNVAFKNLSAAVSIAFASLAIWAFMPCPPNPDTAPAVTPAKIPMMAITASSSTRVNPSTLFRKAINRAQAPASEVGANLAPNFRYFKVLTKIYSFPRVARPSHWNTLKSALSRSSLNHPF